MNNIHRSIKINPSRTCVLLVLLYVFFSQLMATLVNYTELTIWFGAILVLVFVVLRKGIYINRMNHIVILSFFVLALIYVLHNAIGSTELSSMSVMGSFLFASSLFFTLPEGRGWTDYYVKVLCLFSLFHVFSTIIFFLIPSLADVMLVPIWKGYLGTYAAGTENGLYNYRASFTMHYSANGIFCACGLLTCFILYLTAENRKEKRKWFIISVFTLAAVFLTAKRAHLIFSVVACCVTYIFYYRKRKFSRFTKLAFFMVISIGVLYVISPLIPGLAELTSRFTEVDTGNFEELSTGRSVYWLLCFTQFLQHPVIGIGWYGFRDLYQTQIYNLSAGVQGMYLDAHNVYIQLLCETGIVGTVAYIIVISYFMIETVKLMRITEELDRGDNLKLLISFNFQVFYLIYSLTGNCLYDYTYYLYVLACCMMLSLKYKNRTVVN